MLALNVSIACESRGLPSCEVAIRGTCYGSPAHLRACHRVVPATWEMCKGVFRVVAFYFDGKRFVKDIDTRVY